MYVIIKQNSNIKGDGKLKYYSNNNNNLTIQKIPVSPIMKL